MLQLANEATSQDSVPHCNPTNQHQPTFNQSEIITNPTNFILYKLRSTQLTVLPHFPSIGDLQHSIARRKCFPEM